MVYTALRAVAPRTPWLDTDTSQPLARKARSSLAGYASATGTPPGVLPCPLPNVLLSPRATMFIVSAHRRFAPIDTEKARIRIARACRMTPHKDEDDRQEVSRPSFCH